MKLQSHSWFRLIGAGLFIAQTGCVGTSVGNPPGAAASFVQLGVVGDVTLNGAAPTVGGAITIQEAWISLRDVGLLGTGTCSSAGGRVDFAGPVAANLMTGEIIPGAPSWEREIGDTYCALQTEVAPAGVVIDGAPADLANYAVYVAGTRADGTPFELRLDLVDKIRIGAQGKADFALAEGPDGLLLTFDVRSWVSPALLNQAEVKNGVIHADSANNPAVADDAKKHIPDSARLVHDNNRNGALDPDDGAL